jgi:hypothetical protein
MAAAKESEMIKPISTLHYGFEERPNGKVKLYMARPGEAWKEIRSEWRREFNNAVNELVEIQPEGVDLMDVWNTLDYDLPPTPWDWMEQGVED